MADAIQCIVRLEDAIAKSHFSETRNVGGNGICNDKLTDSYLF